MSIRSLFVLATLASLSLGMAIDKREAGPLCNLRITPAEGGSNNPAAIAVDLTYGLLVRMNNSVLPDGSEIVTTISYNAGPVVTDNADDLGSYNVATSLTVDGVSSEQIGEIITGQWPDTLVWQYENPGYNYLIVSVEC